MIDLLNKDLGLEYAAAVQYIQHAAKVTGPEYQTIQKELIVHDAYNPEKKFLNQEIKEKIQSCLHILSPKERAVFLLRDGEGLSIKEASMVLGSSSISIRTHLSRARQKIRARFEKIYPVRNWEEKR